MRSFQGGEIRFETNTASATAKRISLPFGVHFSDLTLEAEGGIAVRDA